MEIFTIKKSEEGKRLDQFLMEQKHWPRAFFMKALRTKKIKVNGRKEEAAFRLSAGDEVRSFVLEKRDALRPVRILYEDFHPRRECGRGAVHRASPARRSGLRRRQRDGKPPPPFGHSL